MGGVNLIPAARIEAKQRRRRLRAWSSAAAASGVLVLALCAASPLAWRGHEAASAAQLAATQQRIADLSRQIALSQQSLGQMQVHLQTAQALRHSPDWSILLAVLGAKVADEVVLSEVQLQPEAAEAPQSPPHAGMESPGEPRRFLLHLRGWSRTQGEVSQFVLRLQAVGLFDQVRLLRADRAAVLDRPAVCFEVSCTLGTRGTVAGGSR